jgi:hypothetical protein
MGSESESEPDELSDPDPESSFAPVVEEEVFSSFSSSSSSAGKPFGKGSGSPIIKAIFLAFS